MSEKLLPCPFCGEKPISGWSGDDECGYWSVECQKCIGSIENPIFCGSHGADEQDAMQAWNRRAPAAEQPDAQSSKQKFIEVDGLKVGPCMIRNMQERLKEFEAEQQQQEPVAADARRYRRLRVLGCAPDGSKYLVNGLVLRFSNLDEFVDHDISVVPSRGESPPLYTHPQPQVQGEPSMKLRLSESALREKIKNSPDDEPTAGGPSVNRFFLDHGMIHDSITGRHIHGCADIEPGIAEESIALLNAINTCAQQPRAAVPDECPHMIFFDDQLMKPEFFAGAGAKKAALNRFEQISTSWNAHLFLRIKNNSLDDKYPNAVLEAAPAQPGEETKP